MTKLKRRQRVFICDGRVRSGRPIHTYEEQVLIARQVGAYENFVSEFYEKWIRLRYAAKGRNCECLLTFKQYLKLAKRAGLVEPDQIGKSRYSFQMGRKGDIGDYVWGNCRFITKEQNDIELTRNGGRARGDAKRSKLLKGRTAETDPGIAAAALKKSRSFIICNPGGKKFKGVNVSAFCREHGLTTTAVQGVCAGRRPHHKGWTGYYVD